ncbi:hypothetical protein G0Q06_02865 [Puniceicoccales bacterium CK1056]|uniref:YcaO-like family protein n=1 Tax=Oceanipulchritudo coccoides TaxID=2706888 RepID=A0A6B2M038_9BACT|nr:hypothetical protein [Oceanipulchritudo coccoides]NDV61387.1 hypothetical protein [Oceanipulchritudo coccoides]
MLNLAPIRYARVLSRHNGPIEKIEYSRIEVRGRALFQANASLSERLYLERETNEVFSTADGTGTHESGMVARHKAISEAIERWALYYLCQGGFYELHGFDEDATSSGMAAFPGLFDSQVRARALSEAAERYCLVAWWEGLLPMQEYEAPDKGVSAYRIENPLGKDSVILTWCKSKGGYYAYGYSAARKPEAAYWQATVEMERAQAALSHYYLDNPGFEQDDLETVSNPMERRVLYYSLPEGHREFLEHVRSAINKRGEAPAPEVLVDEKVEGPWTQYATVWRVLYRMPSKKYLNGALNTFYW